MRTKPWWQWKHYVAYIWKRKSRTETLGATWPINSLHRPAKVATIVCFHSTMSETPPKRNIFSYFLRGSVKNGVDSVKTLSRTAPGQLRDRSGTGPGQVGPRPGQVGNFLEILENSWNCLRTSVWIFRFLHFSAAFRFWRLTMGFRAVWPKYGFGLLECRYRGCCGFGVMCSDLRFPFQSSLSSLASPRFCFLAPNHHPVLLPCLCVLFYHPIFWRLLLHRSRSQIAREQQSQPIPDTLLTRIPQEVFLVSDSIWLRSQIRIFRWLIDRTLELHLKVTTHRVIRVFAITIAITISIVRSVVRSFCHAQSLKIPSVSCFDKVTKGHSVLVKQQPSPHQMGVLKQFLGLQKFNRVLVNFGSVAFAANSSN